MISLRILNTSSMLPSFAITTSYLVKKFSTSFMRFSGLFRNPMLMRLSYFMFWTMLTSERISPSSRIFLLWCIFSSSRIVYFPTEFTFTSRSIIVPFWSNTNSLLNINKFSYFSIGIIWFRTVAIMSKNGVNWWRSTWKSGWYYAEIDLFGHTVLKKLRSFMPYK